MGKIARPAKLVRLESLRDNPVEQSAFALELLKTEKQRQVVEAALGVLKEYPSPAARPVLLELYERYSADGPKRDPGAYIRAGILKALKPVARFEDLPLLERAATTYEQMPSMHDAQAAHFRAAALEVLHEVDEGLASFHCVRLLADPLTSRMSGEPALTAVKLLAAQGNILPVYYYVSQEGEKVPEVLSESLRSLTALPSYLLDLLVERFGVGEDEAALVGLFDLILEHRAGNNYKEFLTRFLLSTRNFELYRYLTLALTTRGSDPLVAAFLDYARSEKDSRKREILLETLPLHHRKNPTLEGVLKELRQQPVNLNQKQTRP